MYCKKQIYNQIVNSDKKIRSQQYEEDYKIYNQLKNESNTYGELKSKIKDLSRGIRYEDAHCDIGERLVKILDREIEGIKIENDDPIK